MQPGPRALRCRSLSRFQAFFFLRRCFSRPVTRRRLERQQAQQHHGEAGVFVRRQAEFGAAVQAQAVEQLRLVGRHGSGQAGDFGSLRVGFVHRHVGHGLAHGHALQHAGHVLQGGSGIQPGCAQRIGELHHRLAVATRQRIDQLEHDAAVGAAEHLAHGGLFQPAGTEGDGLVRQAERVAHGAARGTRQQPQRLRLGRHAFLRQHMLQVLQHGLRRHGPQVELQAAAQHRDGHLLRVGGGEHEFQVFGRLLQRLQHGVEGGVGEHVHFVDHEDLEAPLHRLVDRLFEQALHLVHAAVGGGIELGVINEAAGIDLGACRAHAAWRGGDATLPVSAHAVERLGQDARHRGLAHAARSGEQVGMMQPLLFQRVGKRLHHMLLAHHLREIAGTVFAGQHQIRHAGILRAAISLAGIRGNSRIADESGVLPSHTSPKRGMLQRNKVNS